MDRGSDSRGRTVLVLGMCFNGHIIYSFVGNMNVCQMYLKNVVNYSNRAIEQSTSSEARLLTNNLERWNFEMLIQLA